MSEAAHAVIRDAQDAGVWVFAGGVYPHDEVSVSVVAPDGTVTDGAENNYIAGVTIIDVPSRDEAVQWAANLAVACRCAQEVRKFGPRPGRRQLIGRVAWSATPTCRNVTRTRTTSKRPLRTCSCSVTAPRFGAVPSDQGAASRSSSLNECCACSGPIKTRSDIC